MKPVLSSQKTGGAPGEEESLPTDATDDVNRDLEDDNLLPNDALDISGDPAVLA